MLVLEKASQLGEITPHAALRHAIMSAKSQAEWLDTLVTGCID